MPNHQKKLAAIQQKCVEANPEIENKRWGTERPIRLADVLLAVQKQEYGGSPEFRYTCEKLTSGAWHVHWNLRKDDLTEQSEECISFLYDLLTT